jgi:hypothetical protein
MKSVLKGFASCNLSSSDTGVVGIEAVCTALLFTIEGWFRRCEGACSPSFCHGKVASFLCCLFIHDNDREVSEILPTPFLQVSANMCLVSPEYWYGIG